MSNVMGSMAVNLVFLGVGDVVYRRANLEPAAASSANLTQAALSIALLTIPLLAVVGPELDVLGIHPATAVVLVADGFGFSLVRHAPARPMWTPRRPPQTVEDRPDHDANGRRPVSRLWLRFAFLAVLPNSARTFASPFPTGLPRPARDRPAKCMQPYRSDRAGRSRRALDDTLAAMPSCSGHR